MHSTKDTKPFLEDFDDLNPAPSPSVCCKCRAGAKSSKYVSGCLLLLKLILVSSIAISCAVLGLSFGGQFQPGRSILEDLGTGLEPLSSTIRLQRDYFTSQLGDFSPFTAKQGNETDKLWDSISAPPGDVGMIIVQKEELDRLNLTSTRLKDGSGHLATVDVFHQLHCLNLLRQNIYSPGGQYEELRDSHLAHCIDSIREFIQCHADASILTFKWIEGYSAPWPDFRTYRTCRNFDDIRRWTLEREYRERPGDWRHPLMGDRVYTPNPMAGGAEVKWLEDPAFYK